MAEGVVAGFGAEVFATAGDGGGGGEGGLGVEVGALGVEVDGDWNNQREAMSASVPTMAAVTARSYHPGLVNAAMMDGSVRGFSTDITQETWRAMATRSGGEVDATAP